MTHLFTFFSCSYLILQAEAENLATFFDSSIHTSNSNTSYPKKNMKIIWRTMAELRKLRKDRQSILKVDSGNVTKKKNNKNFRVGLETR